MWVAIVAFGVFCFVLAFYAVQMIYDAIAIWRDIEVLSKISYRAARVTSLHPLGYEIGIELIVLDDKLTQKSLGARESLVRQLEVGKEYIFVCVVDGTVAIAVNDSENRTTPEQDLQLARKFYGPGSLT